MGRLVPLYVAQALATGAVNVSTILATLVMGSLGFKSLMGLPATLISASAALSAGLFGALMLSRGRKLGLGLAFTLGAVGAGIGFAGATTNLMPVFLVGAALMGAAQGGYQQARYAVAESVPEAKRGSALGALMLMSVVGSFLITGFSSPIEQSAASLGTTPEIFGWLLGGVLLGSAALLMLLWHPLQPAGAAAVKPLPLREAFALRGVPPTAMALAIGQGLMVTLMSLTPHRAHEMGLEHAAVAALISGHVLGMFGFGWLTGPLIDRIGIRPGYVIGGLLLCAAALTAPLTGQVWLALSMFLLGLGWNFVNLSGSKEMARHPSAQGVTDSLGYLAAGAGTLLGGLVIAQFGFPWLAYLCAALALLPLLSAWQTPPPAHHDPSAERHTEDMGLGNGKYVQERLPVELRPYLLVGHEQLFYEQLDGLLRPTPYRTFANIRLRDLLHVTLDSQRPAVNAKLRDLTVDFVLVNTALGYRPQLVIELDGRSHQRPEVQKVDRLKDDACASAGLRVLRIESRPYGTDEIERLLVRELGLEPAELGKISRVRLPEQDPDYKPPRPLGRDSLILDAKKR